MGANPRMSEMTLSTDGKTTETVTIDGVDELRTATVNADGRLYLGSDYAGVDVTVAIRKEGEANEENDDRGAEDTEN